MPKSATTLLGLALVALSIVFNTVRYPAVWEMVAPERLGETPPRTSPQKPDSPKDRTSESAKQRPIAAAKPIEVQPNRAIGKVDAEPDARLSSGQGQVAEGSPTPESVGNLPRDVNSVNLDRKPLVPITPLVSATDSATGSVVRRLPPVEPVSASIRVLGDHTAAWNDPTPLYPSTGLQ